MGLLDQRFVTHKKYYFTQSIFSGLLMIGVLFSLGIVLHMDLLGAIGASSLASSICLVFISPNSIMSQSKNIIGAYALGITIGILCYYSSETLQWIYPGFFAKYDVILFGALAVGMTQLIMVILDIEHAPGTGLALGLVLEHWKFASIMVIFLCIVCVVVIHYFLRNRLINLV